jgi:hypothetical protein
MNKAIAKQEEKLVAQLDEVDNLAQQDAGKGTSQKPDDKFYPLLTVLQGLSPQCDEDNSGYMEGAKPGTIWLKNFDPSLVDGKEGITVQPVKLYTEWVQWIPRDRGGGMVGRSLVRPSGARCTDPATNKWTLGGNDLRETRMWVVNLVHNDQLFAFVIPCASTLNTFAKQWNTVIDQQFEPNGTKSAAWRHLWKLTTRQRSNTKGKWYVLSFEHVKKVTDKEMYLSGRHLCESVEDAITKGMQLTETVGEDQEDGGETF